MVKKTDTAAKRLAELFSSKLGAKLAALRKSQENEAYPNGNVPLPDWADPTMAVLTLNPSSKDDQVVITAFSKADLDPADPSHWYILMVLFSLAHFGKWPGRGRPPMSIKTQDQLLHDFYTIRNEKGDIKVIPVCRIMKKRFPSRYQQTAERLAKQVAKARDRKYGPSLAHLLEIMFDAEKKCHLRQNIVWSPTVEAEKRKAYLEMVLSLSRKKPGSQKAT